MIHNSALHGERLRTIFALQIVTKFLRRAAGVFAHEILLHWEELEVGLLHVLERHDWASRARGENQEAVSARLELLKAILNEFGHDIPNPIAKKQDRDICGLIVSELRAAFCLAPHNLVCKIGHEDLPSAHEVGLPRSLGYFKI